MPEKDGYRYKVFHERAVDADGEILQRGGRTVVQILDPDVILPADDIVISTGVAVVHPRDSYNRKRGRDIAFGRALKPLLQ